MNTTGLGIIGCGEMGSTVAKPVVADGEMSTAVLLWEIGDVFAKTLDAPAGGMLPRRGYCQLDYWQQSKSSGVLRRAWNQGKPYGQTCIRA